MEEMFRRTVEVPMHTCDRFGLMRPSALLGELQEAAGAHATMLGVGNNVLAPKSLAWVVARTYLEIERMPRAYERFTLTTWPGKTTRVAYPRFSEGRGTDGTLLFRCATVWLLLDLTRRTMVLPGKGGLSFTGQDREGQLLLPGSIPPQELSCVTQRVVRYSQLDVNDHMNNAKYFDWMEDLLPAAFHRDHRLTSVQINYITEAREGQQVDLHWSLDETGYLQVQAQGENGRIFAARAAYKNPSSP